MVFKRMKQAMGIGGPQIETVLHNPNTTPGGTVTGECTIIGGQHDSDIIAVNLALRTRVEVESGDNEYKTNMTYAKLPIAGSFRLDDGARYAIPFQFPVPWEAPLTHMYGQPLRGMTVGLATELEVARALDPGDLDPIAIHPLPAQERILAAFTNLGFHFRSADCEKGRIWGVHQELPFYQEIEFYGNRRYPAIKEIEVTFVANPHSMEVILELDKRGGIFTEGHDAFARFTVDYASMEHTNWEQDLDASLQRAGRRRGIF